MEDLASALREAAQRALPPLEGELRLPGLRSDVDIARDRWGVPHVTAASEHDLFFAQGYLVGAERGFQLEVARRTGMGRLAELFGELVLPFDRFVRTVGWNRIGRRLAGRWDERSVEMALAFEAGALAALEAAAGPPPEYAVLGAEPWVPEEDLVPDACAAVFLSWSLSRNWDGDLLRAEVAERLGPDAVATLFPDLGAEASAIAGGGPSRLPLLELAMLPAQGSNAWVVSGARTVTGAPLLANDPHLALQTPSAWYEVHLRAPGYHAAGVSLPFSPGVVIGHNDRIAWGLTNAEGDVQDLFLERLSEDGTSAEYAGAWEPLTIHREEIRVRHRTQPELLEVREGRHGPILDSYTIGISSPAVIEGGIRKAYALRWTGAERGIEPSAVYRLNTATDWDSFRDALRGWECPGQNVVYADVEGAIGYQCTGAYPVRRGHDGMLPVPGWTSEHEWDGWIPFEELPSSKDPEPGFVVTANNQMHDAAYPHLIGREFLPPFRARRIARLLSATERHSRASFAGIQRDTVSLSAAQVLPHLLGIEPDTERQARAIEVLRTWDGDLAAGSAGAAIYQVWCVRIAYEVLRPLLGEELFMHAYARRQWSHGFLHKTLPLLLDYPSARWFGRDGREARDEALRRALDAALDELANALGEDPAGWRWGALHRARFGGRLAGIPGLEELFGAGEVECGGDDQTVCQTLFEPGVPYDVAVIPSWRMVLDVSDWDSSAGAHTLGQSGNPASPHYADMLPLWASGEHHEMPFSEAAVEAAAVHRLRLRPA